MGWSGVVGRELNYLAQYIFPDTAETKPFFSLGWHLVPVAFIIDILVTLVTCLVLWYKKDRSAEDLCMDIYDDPEICMFDRAWIVPTISFTGQRTPEWYVVSHEVGANVYHKCAMFIDFSSSTKHHTKRYLRIKRKRWIQLYFLLACYCRLAYEHIVQVWGKICEGQIAFGQSTSLVRFQLKKPIHQGHSTSFVSGILFTLHSMDNWEIGYSTVKSLLHQGLSSDTLQVWMIERSFAYIGNTIG